MEDETSWKHKAFLLSLSHLEQSLRGTESITMPWHSQDWERKGHLVTKWSVRGLNYDPMLDKRNCLEHDTNRTQISCQNRSVISLMWQGPYFDSDFTSTINSFADALRCCWLEQIKLTWNYDMRIHTRQSTRPQDYKCICQGWAERPAFVHYYLCWNLSPALCIRVYLLWTSTTKRNSRKPLLPISK